MNSWKFARRHRDVARTIITAGAVLLGCALLTTACTPTDTPDPTPSAGMISAPVQTAGPSGNPTAPAEVQVREAGLTEPVEFDSGVTVSIVSATAGTVTAETPGEVSGPAVIVLVHADNDSAEPLSLESAVVTVTASDGAYAVPSFSEPFAPFSGEIAPGASADATYVFLLDPAEGREIEVSVNYAAGAPIAIFKGTTSSEGDSK